MCTFTETHGQSCNNCVILVLSIRTNSKKVFCKTSRFFKVMGWRDDAYFLQFTQSWNE